MVFAEVFWKEPNVYDIVGVVGLALALVSIWLAKRDIDARIREARAEVLRQVRRASVGRSFGDAARRVEMLLVAAAAQSWRQARVLCDVAAAELDRLGHTELNPTQRREVLEVVTSIRRVIVALRDARLREKSGDLPPDIHDTVRRCLAALVQLEQQFHGPET